MAMSSQSGGRCCVTTRPVAVRRPVPGLLYRPRAVRLRGHAQDTDMTDADLDHEEHVDAAQGDSAVDMEKVARRHRGGLGPQELPPGGAAALGRGRYAQPFQDPPHRGGSDPVPQAEQFALDPLISPAWVFPRQLLNQHREAGVGLRPAAPVRIGPVPPAARRPSKLKNVRAVPSSRPGVGTPGRSSALSRTSDPARYVPLTVGKSAGQRSLRRSGTPQGI
jgi:hypothetical protein